MQGKRVDAIGDQYIPRLDLGGFGKDKDGNWWVRPPKEGCAGSMVTGLGANADWQVTEYADGTITVSPSIGIPKVKKGKDFDEIISGWQYHGFLEHGVWREC